MDLDQGGRHAVVAAAAASNTTPEVLLSADRSGVSADAPIRSRTSSSLARSRPAIAQRVAPDSTAFAYRDATFATVIAGMWPDPADNEANTQWVKDYYAAIHPHSGSDGGYINFMAEDDVHRTEANFGSNYDRLAKVKGTWDPDNVFHLNQNIRPAA